MRVTNLAEAFASFSDHWRPRVAAELNGQQVRLAKLSGEFVWHRHEGEDELFLVHRGVLWLDVRERAGDLAGERSLRLGPGEFVVVPRGVEHRPRAEGEVEVVLFEPAATLNTGNVRSGRTIEELPRL